MLRTIVTQPVRGRAQVAGRRVAPPTLPLAGLLAIGAMGVLLYGGPIVLAWMGEPPAMMTWLVGR
ncbi:hypothetical protein [Methylobacterium nodulans]|uniref:Uncharacterized protein n=1 Tax=Methylobacterium nodulans (strain LMG 21967 / CNCM I-2342 / ORS 2060) TaxID=460265 RepID=B8IQF9_METNO|nr:hypothetical protein [Methylobacterium nodulans]ACL60471.1 hypothetical protein Mnod_5630 [Methylobacterium nodulans ORS 2060]